MKRLEYWTADRRHRVADGDRMNAFLRRLYAVWMAIGKAIGWVVSHVIMTVIYYAVITPFGLIGRLFGYDPLRLRTPRDVQTYWVERPQAEFSPEQYETQY